MTNTISGASRQGSACKSANQIAFKGSGQTWFLLGRRFGKWYRRHGEGCMERGARTCRSAEHRHTEPCVCLCRRIVERIRIHTQARIQHHSRFRNGRQEGWRRMRDVCIRQHQQTTSKRKQKTRKGIGRQNV